MAVAAAPTSSRPGRRLVRRVARSESATGWLFASPATIFIAIFGLLPIAWSLLLSFQKADLLTPDTPWVGTANYRQMANDPLFAGAIQHTIVYTSLFVPGTIVVGFLIAVALNRKIRGISIYRTAAYVTMAVSSISTAIVFLWLFDPVYGVINYGLSLLHIPQQPFMSDPSQALFVIVLMTVWGWTGFAVVIYLAALQGIPQDVLDAAAIDGASRLTVLRTIVVPLLSPATLFLVVWLTINALQLFDEVYLSTRGGPLYSTSVVVYYLWDQAFRQFNAGYAAAMAYALFLVIALVTAIQFWLGNKFVHYSS
ncbi:MAG: sugar ABC transporter permease [Candidatus Nanopelagicales bacterium]